MRKKMAIKDDLEHKSTLEIRCLEGLPLKKLTHTGELLGVVICAIDVPFVKAPSNHNAALLGSQAI